MQFMLLIIDRKDAPGGELVGVKEMSEYGDQLASQNKRRGGVRLCPEAAAARIEVQNGRAIVTDGPFAECRESIGGAFIIEAASRAEAIELATACPYVRCGIVEVRVLPDRDVARAGKGKRFMFLLHMAPDLSDDDGAGYREMVAYDEALKHEGKYVESSQLALDPPAARVAAQRGPTIVTDGPFAETRETAGGYYVVEAASRAEAIELGKRCPHAKWGSVEVREVI